MNLKDSTWTLTTASIFQALNNIQQRKRNTYLMVWHVSAICLLPASDGYNIFSLLKIKRNDLIPYILIRATVIRYAILSFLSIRCNIVART